MSEINLHSHETKQNYSVKPPEPLQVCGEHASHGLQSHCKTACADANGSHISGRKADVVVETTFLERHYSSGDGGVGGGKEHERSCIEVEDEKQ